MANGDWRPTKNLVHFPELSNFRIAHWACPSTIGWDVLWATCGAAKWSEPSNSNGGAPHEPPKQIKHIRLFRPITCFCGRIQPTCRHQKNKVPMLLPRPRGGGRPSLVSSARRKSRPQGSMVVVQILRRLSRVRPEQIKWSWI